MSDVVVFLGPTLPRDEAAAVLDAEYRGPAGHGDVLRAALRRPRAIAIVDGVFERVPAVWHKEILFALAEGVHVYGASSMGALRAAELDRFGMRGIGEVYRAYAEGMLEDDDEVAVAHADAEHGFRALSDAMVDVRATLEAAVARGIVDADTAADLAARVKATFYPDRLLAATLDRGNPDHERLRAWLPGGWVRRKREDALRLLRTVREHLAGGLGPIVPDWKLQRTRYWEEMRHSVGSADAAADPDALTTVAVGAELEAVLDEARLRPAVYRELLDRALLTALARHAAGTAGVDVSSWAHEIALEQERRRRGLLEPGDVDGWLETRGLDRTDLPTIASRLAAVRWARSIHRDAVAGEIALALRTDDTYHELAARAAEKRTLLASLPADGATEPDEAALVEWYFVEVLEQPVPAALDAWATAHGWQTVSAFLRALRSDWQVRATAVG